MFKIKPKIKNQVSIKKFYERKDKVLVKRKLGGFGDILMQRMMFEDMSKIGLDLYYSCPSPYIELAQNHKYLKNEPIDLYKLDEEDFGIVYDITRICAVTESKRLEKNTEHRSDIWANHCGVKLKSHEMYIEPDPECVEFCQGMLKKINPDNKTVVLLCSNSWSTGFGEAKSLTNEQIIKTVNHLRDLGMFPITTHSKKQKIYDELEVPQFTPITIKTWIALVSVSDLIISIDTAMFHMAGGLKKPLIGIFAFTDGKVYGKYYDFILVQKHRDNGNWPCGPCFAFTNCVKDRTNTKKPCITELTFEEIKDAIKEAITRWNLKTSTKEPPQTLL